MTKIRDYSISKYFFLFLPLSIILSILTSTASANRFNKSRAASNVLLVMSVAGSNTSREPAVALVSPAGSSAPPQPATEPDTSTANTKPHTLENG